MRDRFPAGIEGARRLVTGPRERAELVARSLVDRWHERAAGKGVRSKEARRIAANIAKLSELVHQRNRRRALKGIVANVAWMGFLGYGFFKLVGPAFF